MSLSRTCCAMDAVAPSRPAMPSSPSSIEELAPRFAQLARRDRATRPNGPPGPEPREEVTIHSRGSRLFQREGSIAIERPSCAFVVRCGLPAAQIEREREFQAALRVLRRACVQAYARHEETRAPPAFRLVCVDREGLIVAPARMRYMILASADASAAPCVDDVECQRRIHADGRMQRRRLRPRPEAHAGHVFARRGRWVAAATARR